MQKKCVVFVCHNQESVERITHHLEHEHVYVLLVGVHDAVHQNPKIVTACSLPHNIEDEPKLLTFTAWYAIAKNNLFDEYESFCVLEYDCAINDMVWFQNELEGRTEAVVSFFVDNSFFRSEVNPECFDAFLRSKEVTMAFPRNHKWGCSTNHCIRNDVLKNFVAWFFPYCLYFSAADFCYYSYYHERLFAVFVAHFAVPQCFMPHPNIKHDEVRSHARLGYVPVQDFDWEYYLEKNPDVLCDRQSLSKDELRVKSMQHFRETGFSEKRAFKAPPKQYFVVYDDETGRYDLNPLLTSIRTHSQFDIIVFKKSAIEPDFLERHRDIFALPRGAGYWLWKPYIIKKTLERIEKGSLLFYVDSSYKFVAPFPKVVEYVDRNEIMVWQNKPNERLYHPMKEYCKMDVMSTYFGEVDRHKDDAICWAGALFLKNTRYARTVVETWLDMCCNAHDITDAPSVSPNCADFKDHRHDQSLLTIALHQYMVPLHILGTTFMHNLRYPC